MKTIGDFLDYLEWVKPEHRGVHFRQVVGGRSSNCLADVVDLTPSGLNAALSTVLIIGDTRVMFNGWFGVRTHHGGRGLHDFELAALLLGVEHPKGCVSNGMFHFPHWNQTMYFQDEADAIEFHMGVLRCLR